MKKIAVVTFLIFVINTAFSQKHELGASFGHANLIADIGKTNYIQPFPEYLTPSLIDFSVGILYRFNLNPRQSLRFNFIYNTIRFSDNQAREDYRTARKKRATNDIIEASAMFEYNFFDINDEVKFAQTPYIFAGIGAMLYNDRLYKIQHTFNRDANEDIVAPLSDTDFVTTTIPEKDLKSGFSVPFGIGYKIKFDYNWVLSAEIGVRFTATDRLDYSVSQPEQYTTTIEDGLDTFFNVSQEIDNRNIEILKSNQTGNIISTDWYVITGVNLTYTFGRPPCACD